MTCLPVNMGNPSERTILDLAQQVLGLIESDSSLVTCRFRRMIRSAEA